MTLPSELFRTRNSGIHESTMKLHRMFPPRWAGFIAAGWALVLAIGAGAVEYKAGVARVPITPDLPCWLSGFAARNHPAVEVAMPLWAKALALEDRQGRRAVFVSTDLIGLPGALSDEVAARVQREFGIERARLVLNSTHTHSGPAVHPNLSVMFDWGPEDQRRAEEYANELRERLVQVVGAALRDLAPARLDAGHGWATFAMNRRQFVTNGIRNGLNPSGPFDHDVPVLRVASPGGAVRAVLFGYACHNTTLVATSYRVHGDYAGVAQREIEQNIPNATALFFILCGADQNAQPRGTIELVEKHGQALAAEVRRVIENPMQPVRGPIRAAHTTCPLAFAPMTGPQFEQERQTGSVFAQRRAALMLAAYDQGAPAREIAYPIQAVRLGRDFTLVALGGEVVVDYALRIKRSYPRENMVVAGYSHDVMGYIPSQRILREGGYEAVESMIYYGQPGPFQPDVEERVMKGVDRVLVDAGAARRR